MDGQNTGDGALFSYRIGLQFIVGDSRLQIEFRDATSLPAFYFCAPTFPLRRPISTGTSLHPNIRSTQLQHLGNPGLFGRATPNEYL